MNDNKKSLMERLAENAKNGAIFAAKHGNNIGLSVTAVGGLGVLAVMIGATQDMTTPSTFLTGLQSMLTVGYAGVATIGVSRLAKSVIESVAPDWLIKKENTQEAAIMPGPNAKMELDQEIDKMSLSMKEKFANIVLGTPFELLVPEKTMTQAYTRENNRMAAQLGALSK